MSYRTHGCAVIKGFLRDVPGWSARRLSIRAGVYAGWVSDFLNKGSGTVPNLDAVIGVIARECQKEPAAFEARRLLSGLDLPADEQKDDAA